jgi:hypothetical protein
MYRHSVVSDALLQHNKEVANLFSPSLPTGKYGVGVIPRMSV